MADFLILYGKISLVMACLMTGGQLYLVTNHFPEEKLPHPFLLCLSNVLFWPLFVFLLGFRLFLWRSR